MGWEMQILVILIMCILLSFIAEMMINGLGTIILIPTGILGILTIIKHVGEIYEEETSENGI